MENDRSNHSVHARGAGAGYVSASDSTVVGLLLWMLVRTGEAMAGEQPAVPGTADRVGFNAPGQPAPLPVSPFALPSSYQPQGLPVAKDFSANEFRPRGRSLRDGDFRVGEGNDAPMLRGTNIWQSLAEYRSHDSVRVVTLWETSGSSVSLQAGRKGNPTLQWTSRFMNRGGATRGILDQLLTTSLGGFAHGLHFAPRTGIGTESKGKSAQPAATSLVDGATK